MGEDQALERLRDILARPEFRVDQSPAWWQQLLAPVFDLINYLLAQLIQTVLNTTSGREGWFGIGVLLVSAALIVVVGGGYLVRLVRLSVVRDSRVDAASLAERRERSERLRQTAHQLAAAGQLAEAVRMLYLSALYALDERALLHVESSLTNREHARRLSQAHPSLGATFFEVVERYDRARYGRFLVTEATFAELSRLVERARSASLASRAATS
jgi:Domain of unknown function (DUF4129)